jgi:hypothetical protein
MPDYFDQIAARASEDKEIARMHASCLAAVNMMTPEVL